MINQGHFDQQGTLMTRFVRAKALMVTVFVGVACAACTSDASSPAAPPTQPSPAAASSTRASPAGDVPPPPKVGQCRSTPADHLESFPGGPVAHGVHADDWVDETPAIDCSRTHTLETVEVITLAEKPTLGLVKQLADSCPSVAGLGYLGISSPGVRTLEFVVYWPSPAQRAAGQRWVRCDVGVRAMDGCCQLAPQTRSLRGALDSDPVRFQMCIDQVPDPNRIQPLSSCKNPTGRNSSPPRFRPT